MARLWLWDSNVRGGTTEIAFVILTCTIFYILYFTFLQAQRPSNSGTILSYLLS